MGNFSANDSLSETAYKVSQEGALASKNRFGLLEIEIDLSNPEPTAGSNFSVYVIVTNPFDKAIWIKGIFVFLPSELVAAQEKEQKITGNLGPINELYIKAAQGRFNLKLKDSLMEFITEDTRNLYNGEYSFKKIIKKIARQAIRVGERVESLENELVQIRQKVNEITNGKTFEDIKNLKQNNATYNSLKEQELEYINYLSDYSQYLSFLTQQISSLTGCTVIRSEDNLLVENIELDSSSFMYMHAEGNLKVENVNITGEKQLAGSLGPNEPLQPGNKAVFRLTLQTKSEIFFKPMQYVLRYSVNFFIHPPSHRDQETSQCTNTIAQKLVIRAPLRSVMLGAAVGGFIGAVVKIFQSFDSVELTVSSQQLITVLTSVILSAMAVVFLARKSDTQSLVTVEDFWGGLVVGFLVGYAGVTFFEGLTSITQEGQ